MKIRAAFFEDKKLVTDAVEAIASMKWKFALTLYLFIYSTLLICAQSTNAKPRTRQHTIDSLHSRLDMQIDDTAKVSTLLRLLERHIYPGVQLDSTRLYSRSATELSNHLSYSSGIIISNRLLGHGFFNNDMPDSAKFYFLIALNEAKRAKNKKELTTIYQMLGWIYNTYSPNADSILMIYTLAHDQAMEIKDTSAILLSLSALSTAYLLKVDFIKATELNMESIRLAEIAGDTISLVGALNGQSNIFGTMGQEKEEMKMAQRAFVMAKDFGDRRLIASSYVYLLASYMNQEQYDSLYNYSRELLDVAGETKNPFWISAANGYLGCYYLEEGKTEIAEEYYKQALKLTSFNPAWTAYAYSGLADCELRKRNYRKALEYLSAAENNMKQTSDKALESEIKKSLYKVYSEMGDYKLALASLEKHNMINDSIRAVQSNFSVNYLNLLFETEKKEGQIELLKIQNQLGSVNAQRKNQQKNLALAGTAFIILLGVYGFYRYRRRKKIQGENALMNERLRISRELHDEVGATLSGIAMYSHLTKEQMKTGQTTEIEKSLNVVQQSSGEMVNKLNDIVWLINPEHDSLEKLITRLEEYAINMASIKGMEVKINIPEKINEIDLPVENRRNIYLVCKEAINNAVKYSRGTLLQLTIQVKENKLEFSVSDNGKGFDALMVRRGNGLESMQERADRIGAKLVLTTKENEGTSLSLNCKIT